MVRAIVIPETPALAGPRTRIARLAVTRGPDGRWIGVIEVAGNPYGPWRQAGARRAQRLAPQLRGVTINGEAVELAFRGPLPPLARPVDPP